MTNHPEPISPKLRPFRLLTPFLVWLIVIFALSSYPKAIIPQGKYFSWDKLAHLVEFGVLGYLTARLAYFSGVRWLRTRYIVIAICFGALFAGLDEWHQLHVPGRYASVFDVMADAAGVILGVFIFKWSIFRGKTFSPGDHHKEAH